MPRASRRAGGGADRRGRDRGPRTSPCGARRRWRARGWRGGLRGRGRRGDRGRRRTGPAGLRLRGGRRGLGADGDGGVAGNSTAGEGPQGARARRRRCGPGRGRRGRALALRLVIASRPGTHHDRAADRAGRDHGRQLGPDPSADSRQGARGRGAGSGRGAPSSSAEPSGGALNRAEDALGDGEGNRGREDGELTRERRVRLAEGATARAGAQVSADAASSQHPAVTIGEAATDLAAVHPAALGHAGEPEAGLVDELLHPRRALIQDARDLLVRQPRELAQHERPTLIGRQRQEVLPQGGELLDRLEPLHRALRERGLRPAQRLGGERRTAPEHADAPVVSDPVEPGPDRQRALLALRQGAERADHGALERLLGVLRLAEDRGAVAVEAVAIAAIEGLEGALVPGSDACGEGLVRQEPEWGQAHLPARGAPFHLRADRHAPHHQQRRTRPEVGVIRHAPVGPAAAVPADDDRTRPTRRGSRTRIFGTAFAISLRPERSEGRTSRGRPRRPAWRPRQLDGRPGVTSRSMSRSALLLDRRCPPISLAVRFAPTVPRARPPARTRRVDPHGPAGRAPLGDRRSAWRGSIHVDPGREMRCVPVPG